MFLDLNGYHGLDATQLLLDMHFVIILVSFTKWEGDCNNGTNISHDDMISQKKGKMITTFTKQFVQFNLQSKPEEINIAVATWIHCLKNFNCHCKS